MPSYRPDLAYLRANVETAEPGRLVVMLYDRLVLELKIGMSRLQENTGASTRPFGTEASKHFQNARNIINCLMQSLDWSGGEIADRLSALYFHFYREILRAESEGNPTLVEEILPPIETLRSAWMEIGAAREKK